MFNNKSRVLAGEGKIDKLAINHHSQIERKSFAEEVDFENLPLLCQMLDIES